MRPAFFLHWTLVSAPMLCVLAAILIGFDSERAVALFFEAHRAAHPALKGMFKSITDWSNPCFYALYLGMLLTAWRSKNRERLRFVLILLGVQAVVGIFAVHFSKQVIGRPRPDQGGLFHPLTTRGAYHSLPSGHTAEFFGWATPLGLRWQKVWLSLGIGLIAALVGFSRIYLGWHHPTDVLFGWMLGSYTGVATHVLVHSTLFTKQSRA